MRTEPVSNCLDLLRFCLMIYLGPNEGRTGAKWKGHYNKRSG